LLGVAEQILHRPDVMPSLEVLPTPGGQFKPGAIQADLLRSGEGRAQLLAPIWGMSTASLWSSAKEGDLNKAEVCNSLQEVRENIDRLDRRIVELLAERGSYVKQAARFKKTTDDVKAPQRVEQVIAKVVALSAEVGAMPTVTEAVYRAMISAFINAELTEHAGLASSGDRP
jgi:isochorismate pyruvate lyase